MWYVESFVGNGSFERWEGLTEDQAKFVVKRYFDDGKYLSRYGEMK